MQCVQRKMWVPIVVSASALVTGLVGLALTGDWKLLLVIPPSFALTDLSACICFERVFTKDPFACRHPKLVRRQGAFMRIVLASFALLVPTLLLARLSMPPRDWNWYRICLYLGVVVLPWGYSVTTPSLRLERGALFLFALLGAGALALDSEKWGEIVLISLQFLLPVVLVLGFWWLGRREASQCR